MAQNPLLHFVPNLYDLVCHNPDKDLKESEAMQTKLVNIMYLQEQAGLLLLEAPYIKVRSKIKWSQNETNTCNQLVLAEFPQPIGDHQNPVWVAHLQYCFQKKQWSQYSQPKLTNSSNSYRK